MSSRVDDLTARTWRQRCLQFAHRARRDAGELAKLRGGDELAACARRNVRFWARQALAWHRAVRSSAP